MHLRNENHDEYSLGPALKSGAEGTVHTVNGQPGFVAKVYHRLPDTARVEKLRAMTRLAVPRLSGAAAWPISLLHDGAKYRGFLMPRVEGQEIHQIFNPRERARKFPRQRWDFLLHVARNCADAFDALHSSNVVMGDVNEANILVRSDGCVRLIDCDSYQISNGSRVFTCDVGVDQWTPPELQGASLAGVVRTANHDLFGLAVLIFKLVFMGRHPYAGVIQQTGDFELEQMIAEFRFAFSPSAQRYGMRPPPHSLLLSKFPESVTRMLEAAFLRGSELFDARPTAERWMGALDVIKRNLAECARRPWHLYTKNLGSRCPWCEIKDQGGPDYFESASTPLSHSTPAQTGGLWENIESVNELTLHVPDWESLQMPVVAPEPMPAGANEIRGAFIVGWIVITMAVLFAPATGGYSLWAALLGIGMVSDGKHTAAFQQEAQWRRKLVADTESQIRALLQWLAQQRRDYIAEFRRQKTELRAAFDKLRLLPQERQAAMEKLRGNAVERCRNEYLSRFFIQQGSISGIGSGRVATLVSYGIETAQDIRWNMGVPGIGAVFESKLIAWRDSVAARFQVPHNPQVPAADIARLDSEFLDRHRKLELVLREGVVGLSGLNNSVSLRRTAAEQQLGVSLQDLGRARANLAVIPAQ
jgi:DNA-binding helix-hairpin-helix protein with protein kinase domain